VPRPLALSSGPLAPKSEHLCTSSYHKIPAEIRHIQGIACEARLPSSACVHGETLASGVERKLFAGKAQTQFPKPDTIQDFLFEAKQQLSCRTPHRQPKSRHNTLGLFGRCCPPSSHRHRFAVR
jgi:hypothetical protein